MTDTRELRLGGDRPVVDVDVLSLSSAGTAGGPDRADRVLGARGDQRLDDRAK